MRFPASLTGSKFLSWNLRFKELSSHGKWEEVSSQYHEMRSSGVQLTDPSLFPTILKACSNLPSHWHGKSMHASLIKQGLESFTSIGNSIVDFYIKCGELNSAFRFFDYMMIRDSVSWNIMVYGHLNKGALGEGFWWFTKARVSGFEPNTSTLVLIIKACKSQFRAIHGYTIHGGFSGITSVQNSLLNMYAEEDMECAHKLFDEMSEKDVISWSVMIGGYVQSEEAQVGLELFQEMVLDDDIEPDGVTMVSVLRACANLGDMTTGRLVHGLVISRGFDCDIFVGNSLIDMYSKCNDADSAFKLFDEMPRRNLVSWNSMLTGFVLNEKHSEALSLFHSMEKEGVEADEVTLVNILQTCKYFAHSVNCKSVHCTIIRRGYESNFLVLNSLIDAYTKCNLVELAWVVFGGMKKKDVISWSTMIAGFAYCGKPNEAITVFQKMNEEQEQPNTITIINLLESCSVSADLKRCNWGHGIAVRRGLAAEVAVGTAVVDMYSKCGAIEASRKAFDQIPQKNIVSWSAMIAAYGMNGLARDALSLLAEMELHGLKPNSVTILSVLSACSHGGLVEEGLSIFKSMIQDHEIQPGIEHYSCIVDMLSRAGMLDSAMELIKQMPEGLDAGASIWGALLSACGTYKNSELGAGAISHVLELEPLNSAGYLLASNSYARGGLWVDAAKMRKKVKEREVKVVAGYSLVHVGNKAYRFLAGDETHQQAGEIHGIVQQLHSFMKFDKANDFGVTLP